MATLKNTVASNIPSLPGLFMRNHGLRQTLAVDTCASKHGSWSVLVYYLQCTSVNLQETFLDLYKLVQAKKVRKAPKVQKQPTVDLGHKLLLAILSKSKKAKKSHKSTIIRPILCSH
jgi:hypothetical protein